MIAPARTRASKPLRGVPLPGNAEEDRCFDKQGTNSMNLAVLLRRQES